MSLRDFQNVIAASDAEAGGAPPEPEDEVTCPTCGASVTKIEAAAGGMKPPELPIGPMGGMKPRM
jgi:hypothetical protein